MSFAGTALCKPASAQKQQPARQIKSWPRARTLAPSCEVHLKVARSGNSPPKPPPYPHSPDRACAAASGMRGTFGCSWHTGRARCPRAAHGPCACARTDMSVCKCRCMLGALCALCVCVPGMHAHVCTCGRVHAHACTVSTVYSSLGHAACDRCCGSAPLLAAARGACALRRRTW